MATIAAAAPLVLSLAGVTEFAVYALDRDIRVSALVSVSAAAATVPDPVPSPAPRLQIVAVVDTSGSMDEYLATPNGALEQPMAQLKRSLAYLVDQLAAPSQFALVAFADAASVVLSPRVMTEAGRAAAKAAIAGLVAQGQTNMGAGLRVAGELVHALVAADPRAITSTLFFTDGQPNVSRGSAHDRAANIRANIVARVRDFPDGARVHVFGFGCNARAELLGALARSGGGTYYYMSDNAKMPVAVGNYIGGLLATVARKVQLTLRPIGLARALLMSNSAYTYAAAATTTRTTDITLDLGDLQSGEQRDVLVELALPPGPALPVNLDAPWPALAATLSYAPTGTCERVQGGGSNASIVGVMRALDMDADADVAAAVPDARVARARLRLRAVDAIARAQSIMNSAADLARNSSDDDDAVAFDAALVKARHVLLSARRALPPSDADAYVRVLRQSLDEMLAGLQSHDTYSTRGAMQLLSGGTEHSSQRSSGMTSGSLGYATQQQRAYESQAVESVSQQAATARNQSSGSASGNEEEEEEEDSQPAPKRARRLIVMDFASLM